jgi:ABC-2 type transport system permease protein
MVLLAICQRELHGYFATPVAYVFMTIFLALAGTLTFFVAGFFDRNQADLQPFFLFHPWVYLILVPAITMRLWAEERKSGTAEMLFTLPISLVEAVLGKFLAAWLFAGVCLLGTLPLWVTVNVLGTPDNAVIAASYLGSFLMVAAYIAIGAAMSALTHNQVIAFVLSAAVAFMFTMSGTPVVTEFLGGWLPDNAVVTLAGFSFITHFQSLSQGVLDLRDLLYFISVTALFLFLNALILDRGRAD